MILEQHQTENVHIKFITKASLLDLITKHYLLRYAGGFPSNCATGTLTYEEYTTANVAILMYIFFAVEALS